MFHNNSVKKISGKRRCHHLTVEISYTNKAGLMGWYLLNSSDGTLETRTRRDLELGLLWGKGFVCCLFLSCDPSDRQSLDSLSFTKDMLVVTINYVRLRVIEWVNTLQIVVRWYFLCFWHFNKKFYVGLVKCKTIPKKFSFVWLDGPILVVENFSAKVVTE